jgi:hypothetical protein
MAATLYVPAAAQAQFTILQHYTEGAFYVGDQSGVFSQYWGVTDNDSNPSASFSLSPSTYVTPLGDTVVANASMAYTTSSTYSGAGASLQLSVAGPIVTQAGLSVDSEAAACSPGEYRPSPLTFTSTVNFAGVTAYVSPNDTIGLVYNAEVSINGLYPPALQVYGDVSLGPGYWSIPPLSESLETVQDDTYAVTFADSVDLSATINHEPGPASYVDFSGPSCFSPAPVPEPSTLTLLISALLGLGAFYLRRRGTKA